MNLEIALKAKLATQTIHPVHPIIALRGILPATLEAHIEVDGVSFTLPIEAVDKLRRDREAKIMREKEDRFRYRSEPEMWKRIDLQMAKKRLEHPGVQLELLVMGGIRGSKTDFTHHRVLNHFFYTENSWCWGLHETQGSSKTIQQRRMMEFFPPELNPSSGKFRKDRKTRLSYSDGGGFTSDMFNLTWECQDETGRKFLGGGLFDFKFYKSQDSTLQGAELTCAVSDELVPRATCDTVRERLLSRAADTRQPVFLARIAHAVELLEAGKELPGALLAAIYHGVHLIGFTPKEGYSATVADFLDGAITTEETTTHVVKAEMRGLDAGFKSKWGGPEWGPMGAELLPGKKVPRFKQPKKATRLVAYLHTYDNAHKGNWPAMMQQCQGAPESYIRVIAYGDVSKGWSVRFPKFNDVVHVCTRDQIPREGTWYQVVDPAEERNWFMLWVLVDSFNRLWFVREYPQEGDFIPDIGDPGAWAITSEHGKRNGDPGPAQNGWGFGYHRYRLEIERVEREIGEWWNADKTPIKVAERIMDSRLGWAEKLSQGASTTIMEGMLEEGLDFSQASGDRLREGDQALNDLLDFDGSADKGSPRAEPKLRVCRDCGNLIFMFQNYGDPAKPKDDACKDARDVCAYAALGDLCYLGGDTLTAHGGESYC